jgi:hypothetical protein
MNFELTEEQIAVQQAARDFAQTELLSATRIKNFRLAKLERWEN